jgi:hypothetical protein
VLVAADGQAFTTLLQRTLPEKGVPTSNFAFTIDKNMKAPATALKVRVTSGYQPAYWGLGEIEVFGRGAQMHPDDDLYNVNTDITDLLPGTTYHYRLVATSDAGTTRGADRAFTTPATQQPVVETGSASRITARTARLEGRVSSLGDATMFYFEYGLDAQYGSKTKPMAGGMQITPRTSLGYLSDLKPDTTYHYRLVAMNAAGSAYGEDATFKTDRLDVSTSSLRIGRYGSR